MSILLIDFEATSVDPKTAQVIEIGARLVGDDFKSDPAKPVLNVSHLVWDRSYPDITPEVEKVTGISRAMLKEHGLAPATAWEILGRMVDKDLKYVVAYNTIYDQVLFKEEMFRNALTMDPKMNWLMTVPWLCAMSDIEANYAFKSWRLAHVALEHGCTVCLKDLHRAINDVDLMWDMLKRSGTTADEMYAYQQSPWVYAAARTEKPWTDNGRSNDIAKANGFMWEKAKGDNTGRTFAKQWIKRLKEKDYEQLLTLPIKVERIQV